jgi:hypothetical protein
MLFRLAGPLVNCPRPDGAPRRMASTMASCASRVVSAGQQRPPIGALATKSPSSRTASCWENLVKADYAPRRITRSWPKPRGLSSSRTSRVSSSSGARETSSTPIRVSHSNARSGEASPRSPSEPVSVLRSELNSRNSSGRTKDGETQADRRRVARET